MDTVSFERFAQNLTGFRIFPGKNPIGRFNEKDFGSKSSKALCHLHPDGAGTNDSESLRKLC